MEESSQSRTLIAVSVLLILAVGASIFFKMQHKAPPPQVVPPVVTPLAASNPVHRVIGHSVEGRVIDAYTYGTGTTDILFVGGMHGGYEWNSVLLAYTFMDYLSENLATIPKNLSISVIPDLNPDGVYKVIGKEGRFTLSDVPTSGDESAGRFNADHVDLNRNFGCNWAPTSMWKSKVVSAGTSAFSEPEAGALRDFVEKFHPAGVIFWHSQAGAVYASKCNNGILSVTLDIMNAYAHAAKYPAGKSFDAYPITGDSEGWLASIGIPALTVELSSHDSVQWDKNLAGIKAVIEYYQKQGK